MQITQQQLLMSLAQGIDYRTGHRLEDGHILHDPEVIRALHAALSVLQTTISRPRITRVRQGEAWSIEEDAQLREGFHRKMSRLELARKHGRTQRAIDAGLERLGLSD